MGDLISRQAAIKAICEDGTWLESQGCTDISMAERKQRDADILGELPSVQSEQQWIPCSERLPEKGNEVLVCYDYKGHRSVFTSTLYDDGKFYGYYDEYLTPEGRKYRKVVAWMPLPKPYEERKEE